MSKLVFDPSVNKINVENVSLPVILVEELQKPLEKLDKWELEKIKRVLKNICEESKVPKKEFYLLVRNVLTGTDKGPELPKIISLLGKEKTLKRLGEIVCLESWKIIFPQWELVLQQWEKLLPQWELVLQQWENYKLNPTRLNWQIPSYRLQQWENYKLNPTDLKNMEAIKVNMEAIKVNMEAIKVNMEAIKVKNKNYPAFIVEEIEEKYSDISEKTEILNSEFSDGEAKIVKIELYERSF